MRQKEKLPNFPFTPCSLNRETHSVCSIRLLEAIIWFNEVGCTQLAFPAVNWGCLFAKESLPKNLLLLVSSRLVAISFGAFMLKIAKAAKRCLQVQCFFVPQSGRSEFTAVGILISVFSFIWKLKSSNFNKLLWRDMMRRSPEGRHSAQCYTKLHIELHIQ